MAEAISAQISRKLVDYATEHKARRLTLVTSAPGVMQEVRPGVYVNTEPIVVNTGESLVITHVETVEMGDQSKPERGPRKPIKAPKSATVFDSWRTAVVWASVRGRRDRCMVRKIDGRWMAWPIPLATSSTR